MEPQVSVALQLALFVASTAIIVLATVVVRVTLRLEKQCERLVTAVERVEAELTPLARETRVAVDRLSKLSGSAETAVEVAGGLLLPPFRLISKTAELLRIGASAFLRALWTRRQPGAAGSSRESLDHAILPS